MDHSQALALSTLLVNGLNPKSPTGYKFRDTKKKKLSKVERRKKRKAQRKARRNNWHH